MINKQSAPQSQPGTPNFTRALSLILVLLTFAGCSSLQPEEQIPPTPSVSWSEHVEWLEKQRAWALNGKIGIRQGDETTTASLSWKQKQNSYRIFMAGPLGQGAVDIKGDEQGIILKMSGEETYAARSPEALLQQRLGWTLPLSNLDYWVKGLPSPDSPHRKTLDDTNLLATLDQDSWKIRYRSYHRDRKQPLPHKITLTQGDRIRVTLVVKEWQL